MNNKWQISITSLSGNSVLSHVTSVECSSNPAVGLSVDSVLLDDAVKYQKIEGFGGAFTEAAAFVYSKLNEDQQKEFIQAYFDEVNGLGYSLCRTHINSCDFALGNYAYCEKDGDYSLETFSIEHDRKLLIPLIKTALKKKQDLRIFASPWSPPAWMKTNHQMNRGGSLKPECRKAWADYYCRYIREYSKEGIPIWGLTVQNEPEVVQTWDSCIYTAEEERDFVRDYLGPALHKEGLADVRLMIWDHNRDKIYDRAKVVYSDPEAAKYVWGTAYHWYVMDGFENVQRVHDAFPDKHLIFSEGCQEQGPHLGDYATGERYAHSIIADLNRWTEGWVDWNMLLDINGGPNHVGNFCSAPIIADADNGKLLYQSSYYYIGHFSRFIKKGAVRIVSTSTRDELETLAVINPDGKVVAIVLNRSELKRTFSLKYRDSYMNLESLPHSIMTITEQ
ncbi:MAG: glycoside hydrolase family 30 protein [Fibrobacteres bacterium]|nr:glycoside hydrolase family 30 protein [Fibrobacterota bacterium]